MVLVNAKRKSLSFSSQGKSNKQIALSLDVSQNTVEYHLKNIYRKLGVNSRVEGGVAIGEIRR